MNHSNVIDFRNYQRAGEHGGEVPELASESPLFVDWATISQVHEGGGLPRLCDGWVTSCDAGGVVEFETTKWFEAEGSFDSRMWLRCDGNRVEFHGNISRYGRRDNVFGYDWSETVRRINDLLNLYSLPPFTKGQPLRFADTGWTWTGARVSRIDITMNHCAFNEKDSHQLLRILGEHHVGRQKGTVSTDGTTVMYGYGSKYISGKCYLKAAELKNHLRKKSGEHVDPEVIEFCRSLGVLREEFTLKSRFLTQQNLCWLGDISHSRLLSVYRHRTQLQRLKDMTYNDTDHLSDVARGVLARYENGEAITLKKSKFYRIRKELFSVGVDISVPKKNVEKLVHPVKIIEVAALVAPDWYRKKYG